MFWNSIILLIEVLFCMVVGNTTQEMLEIGAILLTFQSLFLIAYIIIVKDDKEEFDFEPFFLSISFLGIFLMIAFLLEWGFTKLYKLTKLKPLSEYLKQFNNWLNKEK